MTGFLADNSIVRRGIRLIINSLLPAEFQMPIWFGPLKGKRWIVGSFLHKCWLGIYEYPKQRRFAEIVLPGRVVYDVGAHVGFYTLLASVLVGEKGKVIAFEPLPRNLDYLKTHIKINHLPNVIVVEVAVSDHSGTNKFAPGTNSATGHISQNGSRMVDVVTLDDYVSERELPMPDVIKIDIEGEEYRALKGATLLIKQCHPIIFLATHGIDVHHKCCAFLTMLGYSLDSADTLAVSETREIIATTWQEKNA